MPHHLRLLLAAVSIGAAMGPCLRSPCLAKDAPPAKQDAPQAQDEEEDSPTQAPLTVGAMAIASDAALAVEGMAVDITTDRVTYTYKLHNKSNAALSIAASVAMPDLEVNTEASTIYRLPKQNAENPVDLKVKSGDATIATMAYPRAEALGIDRAADLKAAGIPLIPFGEDTEKALAGAKPDALMKLAALGLVTPRDPAQPEAPAIGDWTLRNVLGWTQPLGANATTNVAVAFAPVTAVYTIDATGLPGFDALKDQACLTPALMNAAKAMLKAKGATLDVTDLTLANDGPARWLDNPPASVAVTKPKPNSVVAFCGLTATTENQGVVKGTMPGSAEAAGLRVLIFSAH